ncbi:glycerophosphodiester phosphodiesterase GDPDL3-like [Oryza glaberrima]|uniref:glycerophosphodiester phosphodiesterase GDPDL3-like n=1 Tax=Oryza glaberrima TaxID=4538 RepID=UPI00224BFAB4|nr:glycerophosphodiester phosphodiesterase GDPDL3-like [Oryza glaberrima]
MGRGSHGCSVLGSSLLLLFCLGSAAAQKASTWKTLSGDSPLVIAKGGFSGLFPDSSEFAYRSAPGAALWCDVQLTKDGAGICLPTINIDNCTTISNFDPKGMKTYNVNGAPLKGWFPVDYNSTELLQQVFLKQSILSRTVRFDPLPIVPVEDVLSKYKTPAVWLNVQHDSFYSQFKLSMRSYILSVSKQFVVDYISSPEVNFLNSLLGRVNKKTKLVFRFLDEQTIEPSANQTYGSILKNLTFIKTFASGILVPKQYILPVTKDNYLQPHTSVVDDAHKAGLEIYAADFANDFLISYNYSYDPLAEYLSFIDNGAFSVDGVLTDFPITPSEAIGCFSNLNDSKTDHAKPLVISHNGASGDYPDCTDLAYQKAVADGADVIDCPVQVTKDGIPICMSSIDLGDVTTVATSQFASQTTVVNDIKATPGVYSFNLTWEDISKNLKPKISNPMSKYQLYRNPRNRNAGNFMRLSDFLDFTKGKDLSGVMISIERAAFMAQKLGFGVVDAVIKALDDSGYSKQTTQKVMIQSTNSSVLVKFKQQTKYNLVYMIEEDVRDAAPSSIADIKKFADAVSVNTMSVYPATDNFLTNQTTSLVQSLQSAGFPVYVYVLMNEFVSQPYDFFSDATQQINAYVKRPDGGVDGVITDFPATAHRYKLNSCMNMGNNTPGFMIPAQPGGLIESMVGAAQPPSTAPLPPLTESDVTESPLPDKKEPPPALVFDFQPRDPEDALAAFAVLSRREIPGVVRRRTLRRVPDTGCWLVGHHRSGGGGGAAAAVLAADAFTARWPTDLVVGRHDCRDFTNGLVEELTGEKRVLDALRSSAANGDW